MEAKTFDVAVIGLGAMGAATSYQLSRMGKSVIGFEQFSALHTFGSYHGDTRITRNALGEGEYYVPLALRSNQIWQELENRTGNELFTQCGALITAFGERALREGDFFQTTISAAAKHGIAHELLEYPELSRRFPQFLYREDEVGYYEPGAGFLRPERCIAVQHELAAQLGAQLCFETPVMDLHRLPSGGAEIQTDSGSFHVAQVVVSSGAWIHHFVPEYIGNHFSIQRQVLYWYEPKSDYDLYSPSKCPVYIRMGTTQPEEIYGFPSVDGIGGGLKMATENFDTVSSIDELSRDVTQSETEQAFDVLSRYLSLRQECVRSAACIYTTTPDHDFVIDFLPDFPECLLLSPCSGHGFKHSAAVGELAAQLLTKGETEINLRPFKLDRFER